MRDGVKKGKTIKKYADLFLISLIILSVFFADYSFANFDNYRETSKRQAAESRFQTFLFDLQFNEPSKLLVVANSLCGKYYFNEDIAKKIYFIKAMLLKKLNRTDEMLEALNDAVKYQDVFTDYALFELANYYFSKKNYDESYRYALKLLDANADSLLIPDALILCARIQNIKKNLKNSDSFLDLLPRKLNLPKLTFNAAEIYFSNGSYKKSLNYYKETLILNHNNAYKNQATNKIVEIFTKDLANLNFREKLENIIELTRETYIGNKEALQLLNTLPNCAEKYYYSGVAEFNNNNFDQAAKNFKVVMDNYRNSKYWPRAIYYRYASGLNLGFDAISERGLKEFIREFPYDDVTDNAYYTLAEYYLKKNRKSEALELLKKIRTSYPNNDSYFSALWLEADIYRKNKEYTKSIDVLSLLIKMLSEQLSDRDELVKAYYWRGKNYEASGMLSNAARDFNEVIIRHPMSFYAYRSATKLKMIYAKLTDALNRESFRNYANYNKEDGEIIRMIERILKGNREQENNRFSQFNEFREFDFRDVETEQFPNDKYKNSFYKFYVLRMLRLYDEAIRELEFVMQVKENNPKYIYTLANIYTEADNIRKAIEVVEQMINKFGEKFSLTSMPRRLKTILYPQFYSDIVTFNSARNDVDPYLVFSIIREESRFRTFAVSRAGAQGLMQIMPATGRWIANKMGIPYYRHADLNIPHINVKMGAWYFSYLTKRNKNNLILSLAAYNGGQANVDKWLKEINVDDIDEFVEKIPFRETRNYVKKVMTSYNIYKQIYDNGYNIELTSIETAFSNERLK